MSNKRVAINGFGRIGRLTLRAFLEARRKDLDFVAINDLGSAEMNAHLLEFDTVHGRFPGKVSAANGHLKADGHDIAVLAEANPEKLPWRDLGIDIVMECTGRFADRDSAVQAPDRGRQARAGFGAVPERRPDRGLWRQRREAHAGASRRLQRLLHHQLPRAGGERAEQGDRHRARLYDHDPCLYRRSAHGGHAAQGSSTGRAPPPPIMIPTSTGAAKAVGLVLPELKGKLDGASIRVPVPNVSMIDLTFTSSRPTTKEEINKAMVEAAEGAAQGRARRECEAAGVV